MRRLMRSPPGQPAAAMSPEEAVEMLRFCFADLWDPDAPAPVKLSSRRIAALTERRSLSTAARLRWLKTSA